MAKDKKDKKIKKDKMDVDAKEDDVLRFASPIAHPMADDKLNKKIFKTVKKGLQCDLYDRSWKILTCSIASKVKHVRRGVKEVSKAIRKGEKGLVVIAGDISPLDVISHLPVLCEDHDVPYIFVPSKEKLGEASATKRPTSVSMVVLGGKNKDEKAAEDYKELYEECTSQSKKLVSTKKSLLHHREWHWHEHSFSSSSSLCIKSSTIHSSPHFKKFKHPA